MSGSEDFKVGLVGAAGRGGSFRAALAAGAARVAAVCDIRQDALAECMKQTGAEQAYTDCEKMLDDARLDAVVIGTPMDLHVPQSVMALRRGVHVLCEVPAAISIDQCRELVQACADSKAVYMMAENYTYMRPNVLVRELARRGLFGELYYAEGEYLHELKQHNEDTPWRRTWQTGIAGITYGTHSLGPPLQWMAGDRVVKVCCANTGSHYRDPRGEPYAQDSATMMCKTARGGLIVIRVDMISDRPHAMTNYHLQGTDGAYESSRNAPGDNGKIWLRSLSEEPRWFDLAEQLGGELGGKYMPEIWRNPPDEARRAGHGGGDYFEALDFLAACRGQAPCPIGIHEAMDMTGPGLVSQQSIAGGGAWLDVPDSRNMTLDRVQPQLQMIWPQRLMQSPPTPVVPEGYELRRLTDADEADWLAVMTRAGFDGWDGDGLAKQLKTVVPGGALVVAEHASGRVVATTFAQHIAIEGHSFGGAIGWVAADPDHQGQGIGTAVVAAATARLISAGYTDIYLLTDDFRLPAIKVYLNLGFEPHLTHDTHRARWAAVRKELNLGG